jgi:signal transduction histidine kinase
MTSPRSLRLRLVLGGAVWIVLALAAAGLFITASFDRSIDAARRDDLEANLDRLVAAIDPAGSVQSIVSPLTDPRYDTPLGGLYWQIDDKDNGQVARSRSLWDFQMSLAGADSTGELSSMAGPNNIPMIVLSRSIAVESPNGTRHFDIAVGEGSDQDDDPIYQFRFSLLAALVVLGLALLVAAWLQVHFGLLPLGVLQRQIDAVRRGQVPRLPAGQSPELALATEQINELLEAQDATIAFARDRAADLAHGLKTPLAVLTATSERIRQEGDRANADLLLMLSEQMNARIDYQLRMARLRYRTRAQGASASVNEVVLRSVAVLRKGYLGENLNWLVDLDTQLDVDMDEHDLLELAGIVLENASQWARSQVKVTGLKRDGEASLVVEDDGAGMSDEDIARLGPRGLRLDEDTPGEGLGLAIAHQIVKLNRGRIEVTRGSMGGLRVDLRLPLSRPAQLGTKL